MIRSTRLLTPKQQAEIIRRVQAGEYGEQVARAVGCARSTVVAVASRAGLVVAAAPVREKVKAVKLVAVDTPSDYWRKMAASMRWGGGTGWGY